MVILGGKKIPHSLVIMALAPPPPQKSFEFYLSPTSGKHLLGEKKG
jgi:hypothetical protein